MHGLFYSNRVLITRLRTADNRADSLADEACLSREVMLPSRAAVELRLPRRLLGGSLSDAKQLFSKAFCARTFNASFTGVCAGETAAGTWGNGYGGGGWCLKCFAGRTACSCSCRSDASNADSMSRFTSSSSEGFSMLERRGRSCVAWRWLTPLPI